MYVHFYLCVCVCVLVVMHCVAAIKPAFAAHHIVFRVEHQVSDTVGSGRQTKCEDNITIWLAVAN